MKLFLYNKNALNQTLIYKLCMNKHHTLSLYFAYWIKFTFILTKLKLIYSILIFYLKLKRYIIEIHIIMFCCYWQPIIIIYLTIIWPFLICHLKYRK